MQNNIICQFGDRKENTVMKLNWRTSEFFPFPIEKTGQARGEFVGRRTRPCHGPRARLAFPNARPKNVKN